MNFKSDYTSPFGPMLLTSDGESLTGIYFVDQKYYPVAAAGWEKAPKQPVLREAARQLDEYFKGKRQDFDLPLAPKGTEFQRAVWKKLAQIGFGSTKTYGEIAGKLGRPAASRAVGAATGRNPISIVIPCHRVLASNGKLTGYAGGLARKESLLRIEQKPPR